MDAETRRIWIEQQIALGGKDVLLSAALQPLARAPELPNAAIASTQSGPTDAPSGPEPSTRADTAVHAAAPMAPHSPAEPVVTGPRWMKDLPEIPGPGLSRSLPDAGLLGDAVAQLESLDAVAAVVAECRKCGLCEGRTRTVPGEGDPHARLMCIGEGPGEQEDLSGRPFVGKAGQLLDDILRSIEVPRESVFIANIVKCRPPQNRKPLPDEVTSCRPYLNRQISLVRPKVILALGATAAEALLGSKSSLGDMRGKVHRLDGIPLIVTYHPAALLRNPNWKKPTWDDVRIARQLLDV